MTAALKRILFIEDEDDIRAVAKLALEAVGGFEVIDCPSGFAGLAAAPGARADVILLDVMMPGMDGLATLEALRRLPATAATPVIFMTAKVQPNEVARFKSLGALDVLPKPFSPLRLADDIRRIWARHCESVSA